MNSKLTYGLTGYAHKKGYEITNARGDIVVILSPRNSHYSKETVKQTLETASKFGETTAFIPAWADYHNFVALGYDMHEAKRKAKKHADKLRRKVPQGFAIIDGNEFDTNQQFQNSLNYINNMYDSNLTFQEDVKETTRQVLESKVKAIDLEQAVLEGKNYLLEEIAFFNTLNNTAISYHRDWPIIEAFIEGKYNRSREHLGLIRIN